MQNVKNDICQNDRFQYKPYQTISEYSEPLAVKQHTERLRKFNQNNFIEAEKVLKNSSIIYNNIQVGDHIDFNSKEIADGEGEIDALICKQNELIKLQKDLQ